MAGSKRDETLQDMAASEPRPAPDFRGGDAPEADAPKPFLPADCPVIPLGVLGSKLVFLDRSHQIQIASPDCRKGEMKLWFGNPWLVQTYPQTTKGGAHTGQFDQDDAQTALVEDCALKGPFNPQGKVLGRGAHAPKQDPDILVLHMGRRVIIANAPDAKGQRGLTIGEQPAGMVKIAGQDVFFPAMDALPAPDRTEAPRSEGEAVLALFQRWNWAEPKAAPLLLLGWVAQGYVCGAMEWRAHAWIPGPTATGKSMLQKHIRVLLSDWCLATADASEAGIRQILGNDTLPVSIDEAEAHDNPEKLANLMNLIKKSSFGDKIVRGGADHKGQEFTAQSAFLLSSVIHATLRGEDRNRIALLELHPLPARPEPLDMEWARWRSTGRKLHRRMIKQWPRFARTLAAYKRVIGEHRFEGRWQDTYGTLLACADLLLFDYAPDAPEVDENDITPVDEPGMSRVREAVAAIMPLLARGRVEARSDVDRAVQYLMSHNLPGAHGKPPEPVGVWLDRALRTVTIHDGDYANGTSADGPNETARDKLKSHGMRVVRYDPDPPKGQRQISDARCDQVGWDSDYLAIAYSSNKSIAEIFARSEWRGDGYRQSLAKLEGTISPHKVRFGGKNSDTAVLVPLKHFRGEEG